MTRGRSERGQAAGTLGFAVLIALAAVLALWGLLSIGMDGFRASAHLGFLERLTVAVDTIQDAVVSGRLPGLAFVVISFSLRPQAEDTRVALKADRLVRTAGQAAYAN